MADALDNLPKPALEVVEVCIGEAWINHEASDVHTEADVAADIAERLYRVYGVKATTEPAPKPSLMIATIETPHWSFEGVGRDELEAMLALRVGWKKHVAQTEADPDYLKDDDFAEAQASIVTYVAGECYRDREAL